MADQFVVQDLYLPRPKASPHSGVKPLKCHVCQKDLSGTAITARIVSGRVFFLCPDHLGEESGLLVSEG